MLSPVLNNFATLSQTDHSENFTDQKLSQIIDRTQKDQEEVVTEIATYLLENFSINTYFHQQSKILSEALEKLKNRSLAIVQALAQNQNIETLPQMEEYLKTYSHSICKEQVIQKAQREAILIHDEIRSFPDQYKISILMDVDFSETLFAIFDKGEKKIPEGIAVFFRKQIALIQDKKLLTWRNLAYEWAKGKQDITNFLYFLNQLSFTWIDREMVYQKTENYHQSFQNFVYAKTLETLEQLLEISIENEIKNALIKEVLEEKRRKQLVFYMGHPDFFKKIQIEDKNLEWLNKIRYFLKLKDYFDVDKERGSTLFSWLMYATSKEKSIEDWIDLPTDKKNINIYVNEVKRLKKFLSKNDFDAHAFYFLITVLKNREPALLQIINECCLLFKGSKQVEAQNIQKYLE